MPTPPEGMPWWAWAIVVIALAFIAQTPTLIQSRRAMRDVAEVKEQVKNTHETNLRVDLDRVSTTADDGAAQAKLAAESAHRTERHVEDLVKSIRAMEHSMDRRDKLHNAALSEVRTDLDTHLDAIPALTAEALAQHVSDCPLRQQHQP